MVFDKKVKLLKKYLKKKKESPLLEVIIRDYNNANFYMAILYTAKIKKFKVLYIPLDIMETDQVEEYACYQFIGVRSVEHILTQLKENEEKYKEIETRNNLNKNITNFYIEINVYLDKEPICFQTTRYLPKQWDFLFEPIVTIFEHLPNIMSQLGEELLSVIMNTEDQIDYQSSLSCDLFHDDLDQLFTKETREEGINYYKEGKVEFLEKVNGKYFSIIDDHLIIIEYNHHQKILNLFCDQCCYVYGKRIYATLQAIRHNQMKKFYKISVENKNDEQSNYLCYGISDQGIHVIKESTTSTVSPDLWKKGKIKILEDQHQQLEKALKKSVS